MNSHSLIEVAYMFHEVCSTIVHGENGLSESPMQFRPLDFAFEERLGDLV